MGIDLEQLDLNIWALLRENPALLITTWDENLWTES
jgi:hypothetical protein